MSALENRIKRLVYEDERAKKLTHIANEKAERLMQARERHVKALEEKMCRQLARSEQQEMLKQRNVLESQYRRDKIRERKVELVKDKYVRRERMMQSLREMTQKKYRDEHAQTLAKQQIKDAIEQRKRGYIQLKYESQQALA